MEQRFVAKHEVENYPRGCGTQNDRTQQRGVEIAHDFFEGEQHSGDWRVEGRRQCCRRTDRKKRFDFSWTEMQPPSQDRCDASSDMNGGAFAAKRNAASEGC